MVRAHHELRGMRGARKAFVSVSLCAYARAPVSMSVSEGGGDVIGCHSTVPAPVKPQTRTMHTVVGRGTMHTAVGRGTMHAAVGRGTMHAAVGRGTMHAAVGRGPAGDLSLYAHHCRERNHAHCCLLPCPVHGSKDSSCMHERAGRAIRSPPWP